LIRYHCAIQQVNGTLFSGFIEVPKQRMMHTALLAEGTVAVADQD
jgi:hypothetical protein